MKNPFDIFGIPVSFDVDPAQLERRFRELSRERHPDRKGSPAERRAAIGEAMDLNEAYRTLRDDLARARAVLASMGVEATGEERSDDPEFLMEVMELREALGDAREKGSLSAVASLATRVRADDARAREAVSRTLASRDLAGARAALGRMRYYRRFLDEVDVIEEEAANRAT